MENEKKNNKDAHEKNDKRVDNEFKEAFVNEILELPEENFYAYMIFISLLKLEELNVLTMEEADRLFEQVIPHAQRLREDFEKVRK